MKTLLLLSVSFFLLSCANTTIPVPQDGQGLSLLWSSNPDGRPGWTVQTPEEEAGFMQFIGISEKYAEEQGGREAALRNATEHVAKYLGVLAKNKFEKVAQSLALSSSVKDLTSKSKEFQKQVSESLVQKLRPRQWYMEKWNTPTGPGWKVFVLAVVPVADIEKGFSQVAEQNLLATQQQTGDQQAAFNKKLWEAMLKE